MPITLRSPPSRAGEEPDAAVGVDEGAELVVIDERVADGRDERLGSVGAGLEERGGGDREPPPADDFMEPRRATSLHLVLADEHDIVGDVDSPGGRRGEHEPFSRRRAATQRHLAGVAEPPVAHELVDERMGHHARVDVDELMAAMSAEARPLVAHAHAHSGAIAGGGQRRSRGHIGVGQTPDAAERVDDDLALQIDLHLGVDVLPPAPAAPRLDIRARRSDSTGGGLLDGHHSGTRVVDVLVEDLGVDELPRKGPFDEDDATVVLAGQRGSARGHGSRAKEHGSSVRGSSPT